MTMPSYKRHYQELSDLLNECEGRQIGLAARGERLYVEAPKGAIDDDLRAGLAEHKAELLDYLRRLSWRSDPNAQPLHIPLSWDFTPSEYLAERGLRIVGGDPTTGTLYVADLEAAA